jgi:signal transduction histidine kinase/ligand-binding sensor domain-containing protein/DNA-binding NarL/FixJ family response regulator
MRALLKLSAYAFFLGFLFFVLPTSAQQQSYSFNHITQREGLQAEYIKALIKDSRGYIWLGSNYGLIRYNGREFKNYSYSFQDSTSLSNNNINHIFEDSKGRLWISTNQGLNRFDPLSGKFIRYKHDPYDERTISTNEIMLVTEDANGTLWIGTANGLSSLNPDTGKFKNYIIFSNYQQRNINPYVATVVRDAEDNDLLWLGGIGGFGSFHISEKKFTPYIAPEEKELDINEWSKDAIRSINMDVTGDIFWIGNMYGELIRFNKKTHHVDRFLLDSSWGDGLRQVDRIIAFNDSILWITGNFHGIKTFNRHTHTIGYIYPDSSIPTALYYGAINFITKDNEGIIWITQARTISKMDPYLQYFHNWNLGKDVKEKIVDISGIAVIDSAIFVASQVPSVIHVLDLSGKRKEIIQIPDKFKLPTVWGQKLSIYDFYTNIKDDEIWMSSSNDVVIYNIKSKTFSALKDRYVLPTKINYGVNKVYKDSEGNIWIAYYYDGIIRINPSTKEVDDFTSLLTSLKNSPSKLKLYDLIEDKNRKLWVATHAGLRIIDLESEMLIHPKDYIINGSTFNSLKTLAFAKDKNENIWVGTLGNGLFKISLSGDAPILLDGYGIAEGLADNNIGKIVIGSNHDVWVTTHAGLGRLKKGSSEIVNYTKEDGLPEDHVASYTLVAGPNGEMYLGAYSSLIVFNPEQFPIKQIPPPVNIDNLYLHTKYTEQIIPILNDHSSIDLKYFENNISISFSALNYSKPSSVKLLYQLEGVHDFWIDVKNYGNKISFTGLEPGVYTFRVKAANQDGYWNEKGASLRFTVLPPPWKSKWAYTIYFFVFVLILYFTRNEIVKRERLKTKIKIKEVEAEKLHEIDTLKSRFFANISHEFRTPLTLILGPIEKQLQKSQSVDDKMDLNLAQKNAGRLLNLVNQLLDLSKLESGSLKLHCKEANITEFIVNIASQFLSMAASRSIEFQVKYEHDIICFFDPDKVEKIIFNLLSNAFKFTQDGGTIFIALRQHEANHMFNHGYMEIKVVDNGGGIPPEKASRIFDRFYQVDDSAVREVEGSGIGLALTKELVELHKGNITVTSAPNFGSEFIIQMPLGSEHLNPEEVENTEELVLHKNVYDAVRHEAKDLDEYMHDIPKEENEHPRVLIIEDNDDLRMYLAENLKAEYNILNAKDGIEGLDLARQEIPDLIVSDLMMPKLDGLHVISELRADEKTSHIPAILLTAKADQSAKIEGLQAGVDDYIVKPFDMQELKLRIKNLIESRKKIQEKYAQNVFSLKSSEVKVESVEERFLKKLIEIIEQHIADTSFGVEVLAREVAMSPVQLYRKTKAVTSFKPVDLIRHIRLERAASLLKQHAGNITEVAYQCGFHNLSYFTKCFKEKFGTTPSEHFKLSKHQH